LDATDDSHFERLAEDLQELGFDHLDGVVHAIAAAAPSLMGGDFLHGPWRDVAKAMQTSAYSYQALAAGTLPLLTPGASIVGITFDSRTAWPSYDWMGVVKAALDATTRYVARDVGHLGVRANLVATGPVKTLAAQRIPRFEELAAMWEMRAPLGWDYNDSDPVARAVVALLSDWFPATTGEVIHVDGGVHAIGYA
jgi:enoyl-[acyl-carrier protein] reductase I